MYVAREVSSKDGYLVTSVLGGVPVYLLYKLPFGVFSSNVIGQRHLCSRRGRYLPTQVGTRVGIICCACTATYRCPNQPRKAETRNAGHCSSRLREIPFPSAVMGVASMSHCEMGPLRNEER
jgi:hypothetical protein